MFTREHSRSFDMFSNCLLKWERNDCVLFHFSYHFLVVPFIGTKRFYLKRSHLNAAFQRFTFRNNTERNGTITFPSERGLTCCYIPLEFISPVCLFLTAKENSMKTDAVKGVLSCYHFSLLVESHQRYR